MYSTTVTEFKDHAEHKRTVKLVLKSDEKSKGMEVPLPHHGEIICDQEDKFRSQEDVVKGHSTQPEKDKEDIKNIHEASQSIPQTNPHMIGNRCFTIPCRRPEVVGRDEDLRDLKDYLLHSDQTEKKIALCGLGGIGKTTIVVEYVRMVQAEHYRGGVFWLSGQNVAAFENSMRRLAALIDTIGSDSKETQAKTFNWISLRQDRCLIVLDNLDEEKVHPTILSCITEHGKAGENNHVLITTRRSADKAKIDFHGIKCLTVSELSDTDSAQLFKKVLGNENDENDNDIQTLCSKLYGLPLAIEQAATTIQLKNCKISDYIDEFQEKYIQLLENPICPQASNLEDQARQSVWTTWNISLENIKNKARSLGLDHAVKTLLPLFAYIAKEEITVELINEGKPEIEDENLRKIFCSDFKKREVIRIFKENSVLRDSSNNILEIHPLVQEFIRSTVETDEKERRRVAEFSVAMLSKACEEVGESTVSYARLENYCVTLQLHFEGMDDISLKILELQKRLIWKYWDLKRKDDSQLLKLTAGGMYSTTVTEFKDHAEHKRTVKLVLKSDEKSKGMEVPLPHHGEIICDQGDKFRSQEEIVKEHSTQSEKDKEDIKNIHETSQSIPQTNQHMIGNRYFTIPCRRPEIVGRDEDLRDIKDYLLHSDQTEKKIALCGLGGIGKTTIVVEYVRMVQAEHYRGGVFWLSGQNVAAFENSMRRLAALIDTIGSDSKETQAKTFNWISLRQDRCLIVLDNLDEEKVHPTILSCITEHGKAGENNHVIITTRRSADKAKIDFHGIKCLTVSELSDTDSAQLFKKVLGNENDENENDIQTLCSKLYGLPLAIEQAATTIQLKNYKISDYIDEFQEKYIQLLENPICPQASNLEDQARQSVWTTWNISLENIKNQARSLGLDHAVKIVLPLFAYIAKEEINVELINEGKPEIEDENLRKIFCSHFMKRKVIRILKKNSVLRDSSNSILEIHPLVQEFIRSTVETDEKERRRIAEFSVAMLCKACEEVGKSTVSYARLENHCVTLQLHFEGMDDITLKILELQKRLIWKYWDLKRKDDLQPLKLTAEPLMKTSSNERLWSFVRKVETGQEAIQAVGVCLNPEDKKFDITIVSKEPDKIEGPVKNVLHLMAQELPGYNLKVRHVSEEGKVVTNSPAYREFFKESGNVKKQIEYQQIISRHSENLFKNNRNVIGAFFSPVKSTGFGTPNHVITKELCLTIYVKVKFDKNRIPLWSEKIPEIIDGIKTDVREGYLEKFMNPSVTALHTGSGCEIHMYQSGTLGPFVCSQSRRTGFLASLHVLLSPEELKHIISPSWRCGLLESHKSVYKAGGQELASLTNIYLSSGDETQSTSGYEVGLIELDSNVVAIDDALQIRGLEHYDGEITSITGDNCDQLLRKVGAVTGLTEGIYAGLGWMRLLFDRFDESVFIDLKCQIGVLSASYKKNTEGQYELTDFAKPGDSGALVTIKEGRTHKLVGICTGRFSDGVYIVTPIQQISDRLRIDGWKICTPRRHNNNNCLA